MKKVFILPLLVALFFVGCTPEEEAMNELDVLESTKTLFQTLSSKQEIEAKRPQPTIWADCKLYTGIVVPATFKPTSGKFDELYVMPTATFKDGHPLISDSKPGDQDYNGGRWHMNVLKDGVDPAKYANACSAEDLDLNDFESTPNYFGCPMQPVK